MDIDGARQAFFAEAEELLDDMEQALLSLGQRSDPEDIHRLFRAAHTIKGNSRLFPFPRVETFAHRIEGLLDALRAGRVGVTEETLGLLFRVRDHLAMLVFDAADDAEPDAASERREAELTAELETATAANPAADSIPLAEDGFPVRWRVEWGIGPDLVREGLDPIAVLRCLSRNGCIEAPELRGGLPALAQLEPERCYLSLGFDYLSDQPLAGIRQSFECYLDQSTLSITRADTLPFRPAPQSETPRPAAAAVSGGGVAAPRDATPNSRMPSADGVVRVDAARLEQLVNLVGELVIANAASSVLASRLGSEELVESSSTVTRLVEDIRDSALTLRMVPVAESFLRFERLAEEMAHELGKEVELTLSGGDVELDKAVAEKVGDQLMHLVRNAIDHGIETPHERAMSGKPRRGRLALDASHESGSVIIRVADDGRGMDLGKLLGRARAAGLIAADRQPSEREILRCAFEPGMSTADRVSNYSGRGVGLDAVRRKVESLRGSVELESEPGKGTAVSIHLPLTLSIIDGFRVSVAGLSYVLPLDSVIECIEVEPDALCGAARYTNLRGEVLPLLRLRELFGEPGPEGEARENILVVSNGGQKAGLLVDELLGEYQTVIKPLGRLFAKARGLSGATILGSGEVALILSVPQLIEAAMEMTGGVELNRSRCTTAAASRHRTEKLEPTVTGRCNPGRHDESQATLATA